MSKWIYIQDIDKYEGKLIIIKGWVFNKRRSGKIIFLLVRDGTGIIQSIVIKNEVGDEIFDITDKLTQESSIIIEGIVRKDKRAPGGFELGLKHLVPVGKSIDYPISPKEHGIGFLMQNRHLWLRSKRQNAILRIRAEVIRRVREFLDNRGYVNLDAPIFTPAACEGTTTLFPVKYFEKIAYLSQSGQLYNEATCIAFGKVYCFGPAFRAEKSKTRRHLTEFWQVEPEMAYFDMEDAMRITEEMLEYVVENVLKNKRKELEILERDTKILENVHPPFPRITYQEAIEMLQKKGVDIKYGADFGAPDETALTEEFGLPFFIYHFPVDIKAFYMKRDKENPDLTLSFDLLAPEGYGEIVGGGQREDDYDTLLESIQRQHLSVENFKWYLDLRKYGSVPHSGFGLGIERTVAWIGKIHHVRETIPFPRMLDTIYP